MPNWHTLGRIAQNAAFTGLGLAAHLIAKKYGNIWFAVSSGAFSIAAIVGFGRILWEVSGDQKGNS